LKGKVTVSIPYGLCDIDGDLYYGAPASVLWDGKNVTYCYINGDHPVVGPVYGSMSGTIYRDTAYTVYVVLQNGVSLHLNGGLVNWITSGDLGRARAARFTTRITQVKILSIKLMFTDMNRMNRLPDP
jgi:hypothetical protein